APPTPHIHGHPAKTANTTKTPTTSKDAYWIEAPPGLLDNSTRVWRAPVAKSTPISSPINRWNKAACFSAVSISAQV
ncbi:MAG: hypothetical protein AAGC57_21065, partial [Pseudomonadota bacterium]